MKKMEIFQKNLEEASFTTDFIKKALEYFNELTEEMEVQELKNIEEVIQYFDKIGSYTCNTSNSENNLKLREDILKLFNCDSNGFLDLNLYFQNIEKFEIQILYVLFYEFYPITMDFVEMKNFLQNNRSKKNKKHYNGLIRTKFIKDC